MLDETRPLLPRDAQPLGETIETGREGRAHDRDGRPTADGAPESGTRAELALAWQLEGKPLQRALLADPLISLGSHADNTVVIEHATVSRFHARLQLRGDGRVWLRDLGSKNGTRVDGAQISEAELQAGMRVRLGDLELRVERASLGQALEALPGMVARDPIMAPVVALLGKAARSRIPVVLRGETGTGKEVAARALHAKSERASGPFVAINCGAISPELAEAELFGHEKGAFTGAVASAPGAFGAADGGTLFLDEIAELPLNLQVKLLRALESDEVKPVGAARARKVDARIVCASHRELRACVRAGSFREDLYYRLQGVEILLPPLRARPRDIVAIAEKLLQREGEGARLLPDARAALLAHSWPGNARELIHTLRLALLLKEGTHLRASDLRLEAPLTPREPRVFVSLPEPVFAIPEPRDFEPETPHYASQASRFEPPPRCADPIAPYGDAVDEAAPACTLQELEERAIRASFARHRGHRRAMCDELGMSKSSLQRRLIEYRLEEP